MSKANDRVYAFAALNTTKHKSTKLSITVLSTRSAAAGTAQQAANDQGLDTLESFSQLPELLGCPKLRLELAPSTQLNSGRRQTITIGKQFSAEDYKFESELGDISEETAKQRRSHEVEKTWDGPCQEIPLPALECGEALELFLRPPQMPDESVVAYRIEHLANVDENVTELIGTLHALFAPVKRTFD